MDKQDLERMRVGKPLEVELVGKVSDCRSCKWFWEKKPYGPYPAFDFQEDFPRSEEPCLPPGHKTASFRWLEGRCAGQALVVPQLLHGCRKAPIMTIGINPNLTGFWPGVKGAIWSYPLFSDFARFAYYYRYRTVYQESFSRDFILAHIEEKTALRAKAGGYIRDMDRSFTERNIKIGIEYVEGGLGTEMMERSWDVRNHFVMLYDAVGEEPPEKAQFNKGDILGGVISLPRKDDALWVHRNRVDYYQRFVPIFERFSAYLRSQDFEPHLAMAKDVCQLDMVACASPGWSSKYEIDKDEVVSKCVEQNAWAVKQLVQTQPGIIVFSGRSAFKMFNDVFKNFIHPRIPPNWEVYELLSHTQLIPHYLEIKEVVDGVEFAFRSRIVISPHFSYDDNFVPHARFSPRGWEEFKAYFPLAYKAMDADGRVRPPSRDGYVAIDVTSLGDFKTKYPGALTSLIAHLYETSSMIADALVQEFILVNIAFDPKQGGVARASGPCRFCVNDTWRFPEGCPYGKPEVEPYPQGFLEKVVEALASKIEKEG